jgi:DNA-directed RNA polymerase specialized sigma subunit
MKMGKSAFVACDSNHAVRIGFEQNSNTFSEQSCVQLLAQRMAQLPPISKKVIALYYHENMQLAALAACFGFSEDKIRQILLQTLDLLRTFLADDRKEGFVPSEEEF